MDNLDVDNSSGNDASGTSISHSPLNLGGGEAPETPKAKKEPKPMEFLEKTIAQPVPSAEPITAAKIFYTKLNTGTLGNLDEQITTWLKENPNVNVKMTNMITGEVKGKTVDPSIVIMVWY